MSSTVQPKLPLNPKSEDWRFFKRQFENYLLIVDTRDNKQLPYLMSCLGRDGYVIYDGLPDPKASYADAIARFDDYFKLRSSVLLRRKHFFEARQEPNENIMEYSCRLRRLINECDFQTEISKTLLRDIFVCGVCSDILGEKLLSEDAASLTFEEAITRGEAWERAHSERRTVDINHVNTSHPLLSTQGPQRPTKPAIGAAILFISHLAPSVRLVQPLAASAQKWVTTVRCAARAKLLHNNC